MEYSGKQDSKGTANMQHSIRDSENKQNYIKIQVKK